MNIEIGEKDLRMMLQNLKDSHIKGVSLSSVAKAAESELDKLMLAIKPSWLEKMVAKVKALFKK